MLTMTACPIWPDVLDGLPWRGVGRLAAPMASNLSTMGNALMLPPLPAGELRLPRTWLCETSRLSLGNHLVLRRLCCLAAPDHAPGCPELRPASVRYSLGQKSS